MAEKRGDDSMTVQEKLIIESILADVGLESLRTGADNQEKKTKQVGAYKKFNDKRILR